jgi:hypothetical protein
MKNEKKCKVLLLPTNEKATIGSIVTRPSDNRMAIVNVLTKDDTQPCIHQHLYFLSDEEIKEGDWCIIKDHAYSKPIQVNKIIGSEVALKTDKVIVLNQSLKDCNKIIAITDKSLMQHDKTPIGENVNGLWKILPQPSQSFIEKFVEEYNKGNVITEVMVEYHEDIYFQDELQARGKLKINPKDNTITIRKAKDSWSREEVVLFAEKYARMVQEKEIQLNGYKAIHNHKWIEENL